MSFHPSFSTSGYSPSGASCVYVPAHAHLGTSVLSPDRQTHRQASICTDIRGNFDSNKNIFLQAARQTEIWIPTSRQRDRQPKDKLLPVIWLPVFFVCLSTARLPGCLSFCLSFGSVFLPVFWLPVFLSFRLPVFLPFFWLTVFLPVFSPIVSNSE